MVVIAVIAAVVTSAVSTVNGMIAILFQLPIIRLIQISACYCCYVVVPSILPRALLGACSLIIVVVPPAAAVASIASVVTDAAARVDLLFAADILVIKFIHKLEVDSVFSICHLAGHVILMLELFRRLVTRVAVHGAAICFCFALILVLFAIDCLVVVLQLAAAFCF